MNTYSRLLLSFFTLSTRPPAARVRSIASFADSRFAARTSIVVVSVLRMVNDVGVADIGWIINAVCRPREEHNWPGTIDGLFVESVDTVAGTYAAGTRAGLTSSGLWLRVRQYGLGMLHWEKNG